MWARINSSRTKTCIFLAFLLSLLANWQIAAEENFKELGPVSIRGESGKFEILVNGQLFARDNTWYVSTVDGFPSRKSPKWVLISFSNGGTCCPPSYRILDLTQETPRLSAEFYSNNYVFTGQQVIFDAGQDAWAYDQHGLAKLPTLSMEAKLQEGMDAYKRGEYAKSLRFLWPLRSQKNEASYYLGLSYLSGQMNLQRTIWKPSLFPAAAEMGNTQPYSSWLNRTVLQHLLTLNLQMNSIWRRAQI